MPKISEKEMADIIAQALEIYGEEEPDIEEIETRTFEDEGVMTYNEGLVVRIGESKFQITIVECR